MAGDSSKGLSKKVMAAQLGEAAALLTVLAEDPFRARAFQNAARGLEAYEGDTSELLLQGRLTEIKGIGKGLAAELSSLQERDQLAILEGLRARVPAGVRGLFSVSGLGAKKIGALWRAGIGNLDELLAAAQDGRVAALKGFGEKSAEKIAAGAAFALTSSHRMRLDEAEARAAWLAGYLREVLPDAHFAFAGSLRRGLETVGDLDVVLCGADFTEVEQALTAFASLEEVTPPTLSGHVEGKPLELIVTEAGAFGAVLAQWTGAGAYRATLHTRAEARGYTLNERGLFQSEERLETPEEADLFNYLDLPYIPPERREDAHPEVVPLLAPGEVKGLVHNHSSYSDGAATLREMVAGARARGYAYLAMADHSRSSFYANGLSIERVATQAEEIAAIRAELKASGSEFGLLHGLEVDILPDGGLDYPDEVLAQLDYIVVSVHQHFQLSEKEQTARIIKAVRHPYVSILGHATGRLLLRRPGYAVDLDKVIAACAETGTAIEINTNPRRLDLDWHWVIKAKALGCAFSIDPDAHQPEGFADVRYGVLMARKAGLAAADVVNTAPTAAAFLARLKRPSGV